jgi:hypothetical protein
MASAGRVSLALFALLGGVPMLIWFSWLRETPLFWRNDGGYPVWLRALVLHGFYPLFFSNLGGTFLYLWSLISHPPRSKRLLFAELTVFTLLVASIGVSILLVLFDDA